MQQSELGKPLLRKTKLLALHSHRSPEFLGEDFRLFHRSAIHIVQCKATDYRLWHSTWGMVKNMNSIVFRHG